MSKSEISRICQELGEEVERFRNRRLGAFPYLWLDATHLKVREDGRVQSMALVVATGVRDTGEREVLGLDVGPSEDGAFWLAFLRGLVARGLKGVKQDEARTQLRQVAQTLGARFPKVAQLLFDAEDGVLAFMAFPERH